MVLSNFNHSYISKYILKFTLDAKIDEFEKNIFPPSKQCAMPSKHYYRRIVREPLSRFSFNFMITTLTF